MVTGLLITKGKVERGFLGISGQRRPIHRKLVIAHKLLSDQGVFVIQVTPNSPAEKAGLRVRDMIIASNDTSIGSIDDLHRLLTEKPNNQPMSLTILRRSQKIILEVLPSPAEIG